MKTCSIRCLLSSSGPGRRKEGSENPITAWVYLMIKEKDGPDGLRRAAANSQLEGLSSSRRWSRCCRSSDEPPR